ncbi:MAG: leucine-rich repeat protein, partial [Muribaculum sp.]|nr:leucine-rich repeat protein [Muribaculum sp.]
MRKKLPFLLLAAMTIFSIPASAFEYTYKGKTLNYTIKTANTVEVATGNKAVSGDLQIPSTVISNNKEYTVASIAKEAFLDCSGLTSVSIPNTVTSIGEFAFYTKSKMNKVEFTSIEHICRIQFKGNISNPMVAAEHLYIDGVEVKDLVIPTSVTSICEQAFIGCTSLTSVLIPNSVTTIGANAFAGCTNLTSVSIPTSVTFIGEYAFEGGTNLKLVIIDHNSAPNKVWSYMPDFYSFTLNIVPENLIEAYKARYPYNTFAAIGLKYDGTDNIFNIGLNDNKTLALSLTGAENVTSFQTDITLPAGLSIATKAGGASDVTLGAGAAASHVVAASRVAGDNTYRVVVYSGKNEAFTDGKNLLNLNIASDAALKGGDITLGNSTMTLTIDNESYTPDDVTITVPSFIGVESIEVTPATASVNMGSTLQLAAEALPSTAWEKTVTWKSSDESVATVDNKGVVTPVAKGTVVITATATDGTNVSGSATITVTNYMQSLTLGAESMTIEEDETLQLTPTFSPADADATTLSWTSTDGSVAYADGDNVLHAIKPGTATLT